LRQALTDGDRLGITPFVGLGLALAGPARALRERRRPHLDRDQVACRPAALLRSISIWTSLRDLERTIARLPDEQRQVILLVGLEGIPYEEAATVLGIPIGTVRSRLSRGRDLLRRELMDLKEDAGAARAKRPAANRQRRMAA
jgi:Sigma-70, region 4